MPEGRVTLGAPQMAAALTPPTLLLAVSCLATHEVTWPGRVSFGVSERERRVLLDFTSSFISANTE